MLQFTREARLQIDRIRSDYTVTFPQDPPNLLFIGLGWILRNDASESVESIGVGFYQRSELTAARLAGARESNGMRYVLVNPERQRRRFDNATLSYSDSDGFFLT